MSPDANDVILGEVTDLVREFAARFDRARVDGPTPHPPAGIRLVLSCLAPGTARITLYPSDDDIDVHTGEHTWIELLKRKRDNPQRLQELRPILDAVVNGRFEETIWRVRGTIVRSRAVLCEPDGRAFFSARRFRRLTFLDPRAKRTYVKYEPYS